jgi:hypothetical protein
MLVAEERSPGLIEFDPKYVDVIVRRWQEFAGKAATLLASGETFAETEEARREGGPTEESVAA